MEPYSPHGDIAGLIDRAAKGNDAFMNGNMVEWQSLLPLSPDFSIMTPFGGWAVGGFDASPARLAAMAAIFTSATTSLEVIATYATTDMVVLAVIERQNGIVGGLAPQDWSLRVTLVFRREGPGWHLVHRHADPLVKAMALPDLAAIARR